MHKSKTNRYRFLIYLVPIIILILLVTIPKFKFGGDVPLSERIKVPLFSTPETDEEAEGTDKASDSDEETMSLYPVYPNAQKIAMDESKQVEGATFYSTTDSIDEVYAWYMNELNVLENQLTMVDFDNEGERTITISAPKDSVNPENPRPLVEIKYPFFGQEIVGITITTFEFYTSGQPIWIGFEPKEDEESSTDKPDEETKD